MARFNAIKCWHVTQAIIEPDEVKAHAPSFTMVKKSILKTGYRGFAIEDRETLQSQGWYRSFLLGEEARFYIDGSGVYRLANCDLTENELYFERLNVPIGQQPWIFYSWQSDHNPSRSKIGKALRDAVDRINELHAPRRPLEVVEATRDADGSADIVDAIRRNIDLCMFAMFDITNVSAVAGADPDREEEGGASASKAHPNANVVFEMSYAMARKSADQVLLLEQNRKNTLESDEVPFDFAQRRHMVVGAPKKLSEDIESTLLKYLQRRNFVVAS